MPQSQSDMILDSITIDNIDDAMFFYSLRSTLKDSIAKS